MRSLKLPPDRHAGGVVTHSSGNHAQALALAARLHGIAAHIVMPANATPVKRRAVEDYGARVILCEPTLAARETTAARVLEETGGTMIPPYNHPHVIAGQGTTALELLEQVPDLDAIVAPIGGGGLVAGITIAAKGRRSAIKIFAAEPAGADDAFRSKAAGKLIPQTGPKTIADGLLTSLGELTWPVVRDMVDDVLCAGEAEIIAAMRMTWEARQAAHRAEFGRGSGGGADRNLQSSARFETCGDRAEWRECQSRSIAVAECVSDLTIPPQSYLGSHQ